MEQKYLVSLRINKKTGKPCYFKNTLDTILRTVILDWTNLEQLKAEHRNAIVKVTELRKAKVKPSHILVKVTGAEESKNESDKAESF